MAAIEIIEGNDELLISILILLPPKSIFKLRCVSKRWYHILDQPIFLRTYSNSNTKLITQPSILGFILDQCLWPITQSNLKKKKKQLITSKYGDFINSSNGLILFNNHPHYNILNPVTRSHVSLPCPDFDLEHVGFSCEENTLRLAPNIKVVGFVINGPGEDKLIGTYSSETRKWIKSTVTASGNFKLDPDFSPTVLNGIFHWNAHDRIIAVYDSTNRDENYVQLIQEPSRLEFSDLIITRSTQDDVIWVGGNRLSIIELWMLPKDEYGSYRRSTTIPKEEWVMVHKIEQDCLLHKIMYPHLGNLFRFHALIPGEPILCILNIDNKPYRYDPEKKSIELIPYQATAPLGIRNCRHPYMEPHFLSSYALSLYNQTVS